MKKTTPSLIAFLLTMLFVSCGPKPILAEHPLVILEKEKVSLNELGNGTILIYNDANILHTADATSRLNIHLNDKNVGQLRAKDFVVVQLNNGNNIFNLKHWDVVNMRSEHTLIVTDSTKVIRVKPTVTSNKLEVINQLPDNWVKYRYMDPNR